MNNRSKIYEQLTSFRTYIISLLVGAVGVILLLLSELIDWQNHLTIQTLLRDFGSLLIASIAVAIVWELSSKRAFYAEALSTSRLVDDVTETGLIGVSAKWHGDIDWRGLFKSSYTAKFMFWYSRTWRNTNREHLREFASRANTSAILVLPDPSNEIVVSAIGSKLGKDVQEVKNSILEAQNDFIDIFNEDGHVGHRLEIWYVPFIPMYSCYGLGDKFVFTMYQLRKERVEVPTFIVENGGTLFEFFTQEFESIVSGERPIGTKAFPPT